MSETRAGTQVDLVIKNPPANAGDIRGPGSVPGSGRSPGEGNGNPLQYACLENPMVRGAWQATVHGVTKSRKWLSTQGRHQPTHPLPCSTARSPTSSRIAPRPCHMRVLPFFFLFYFLPIFKLWKAWEMKIKPPYWPNKIPLWAGWGFQPNIKPQLSHLLDCRGVTTAMATEALFSW